MHKYDVAAILTIIVGIGSIATTAAFGQQLADLFGPVAPKVLAAIGLVSTVASVVLRVLSNPSPPSGTSSVVADNATGIIKLPPSTKGQ